MSKEYFVSFVEEAVYNPEYAGWTGGRVEVYVEDEEYNIEEIRFLCHRDEKYAALREKWDFKDLTEKELSKLRELIKREFYYNLEDKHQ